MTLPPPLVLERAAMSAQRLVAVVVAVGAVVAAAVQTLRRWLALAATGCPPGQTG